MIRLKHLRVANFKALRDIDLAFPNVGSILIEGLNESGKSTLFEAVYFALYGNPLGTQTIESTIRYGAQESFVELGLSVDATEIVIQRHTRVGRRKATLTITPPGELTEIITGPRPVSARIIDELRLDGDTLLNSCFVEQKKLQRLEGLTAQARRDSLLKLLNLEGLTRLETQFKVARQDEEAILLAGQRRDLAQVRTDIPVRQQDLACTERRIAARRILGALDRIDGHRAEIQLQEDRRGRLNAEQLQLEARLQRIANLDGTDQVLGRIDETDKRRLTLSAAEASARAAIDEVERLRDVDLPAIVDRLAALQDLTARVGWLERCEAGIASLSEGAGAWADAKALDERAQTLEGQCAAVGEQIQLVAAMRAALQRANLLDDRTQQLDASRSTSGQIRHQLTQLQGRAESLPAERELARGLLEAAESLDSAQVQVADATRRRDRVIAWRTAQSELDHARTEQGATAAALNSLTIDLEKARSELREAEAARTQSITPILRGWIRARATADQAEGARREDPAVAQQAAEAERQRQRAATAVASVGSRAMLLLGAAAVGLVGGTLLLATLGSPLSVALLIVGLIIGVLGIRTLGSRGSLQAAAQIAEQEYAQAQQLLAELRSTVAASRDSHEQLNEAESLLREMGHEPLVDLADGQARLTTALAQEGEQQRALDREQTARTTADELGKRHIEAQVRAGAAQSSLTLVERQFGLAQQAAEARPAADPEQLLAQAEQELRVARDNETARRLESEGFLESATPERLRIEAASKHAAIDEAGTQLRSLPNVQQRLAAEQVRAAVLEQTIMTESQQLDEQIRALQLDNIENLQETLQTRLRGLDEVSLQRTQAQLNAEIGGARETAQRQRSTAAKAWQSAVMFAAHSPQPDDALQTLALDLHSVASKAVASPHSLGPEIERLAHAAHAHREALGGVAASLGEPLELSRLRAASTELGMQQRQIEERIGRLPALQELHSRATADLADADAELRAAWNDVDSRLAALGLHDGSRDVGLLRQRVQGEVRSLDEPATRARLNTVIGESADAAGAIRHRQEQIGDEERTVVAQLAGVGLRSEQLDRPAIAQVLPELDAADLSDEGTLVAERERFLGEIAHLKTIQQELETMLDLRAVVLDLSDEQAKLDQLVRSREVKRRATQIITTARGRMMDRVLPGTEQNLRLLLPQLTAERYFDAKLDGEYRLSVWDTAAQQYVAKDIFSGGTRDQFSLALRLAFALATLPQELGTTPGFIFLDEPLSAFDLPRTEALVELLTDGQIAKSFAQIFLISHSRSFDPSLFAYYVRMEAGRVAATNLPTPSPTVAA